MKKVLFRICVMTVVLVTAVACNQDDTDSAAPSLPTSVPAAVSPTEVPDNPPAEGDAAAVPAAPTPTVAPTPRPPKALTVCLAQEPTSLYLYGDASLAALAVRHAVYENLFTSRGYAFQPQGLVDIPTLANGGMQVLETAVVAGDRVVDADGAIVTLQTGTTLRLANGDRVAYDGETAVTLPQLVVDFTFQPMMWSDGTPVTAADSVFSFAVASDPSTRTGRVLVNRTASYVDINELTTRWTGLPGFVDANVLDYVWTPLPLHQLGQFTLAELAGLDEAARQPLSSGPFVVAEWLPGEQIVMTPNPFYYQADAGLPRLDQVTFRFLPADGDRANPLAADLWQDGVCDVMTQDAFFVESLGSLEAAADTVVQTTAGPVFEHIDFGVNSYGVYGDGRERPDWFDTAVVRQAMTLCTNRQAMVDSLLNGRSVVMHAYVPDNHPLYSDTLPAWDYDPAVGNRLLDEAGYVDTDGDGVREDPISERPFQVSLLVDNGNNVRQPVSAQFAADMAACGIQVDVLTVAPLELYADGPAGTVFGRSFDMAQFAWLTGVNPPCHLWLTRNITGPREEGFGGWGNVNPTGWSSSEFDAACETAVAATTPAEVAVASHQQAMALFAQELPVMPLFAYPKVTAARDYVQNLALDSSQLSELWNIAELDVIRP